MSINSKPLNLDRVLKLKDEGKIKHFQRIYRAGIELEGGWHKLPDPGMALVHDGSVQIPQPARDRYGYDNQGRLGIARDPSHAPLQTGELPSEPMEVGKVPIWMKKYYPDVVNASCGLHAHMSFKSALHYQLLMDPSFQATILEYVRRWSTKEGLRKDHPIWGRLSGKSEYCQHDFFPDEQASRVEKSHRRSGKGHRYTVVNYPFSLHQTIEVRLLPMMEGWELGFRAVQEVFDITNASLILLARKEEKLKAGIEIRGGDELFEESRRLYV